ncbi:Ribonuclease H-like superfamily protein [Gossypium australe]|uniref:Ribonuclease H-like superfamily protein n=1 Tax=Gossypium australe TaxID=47621 RepID=A0A5B6UEC2_9ROSI|nr:Ribonuclease H-like superfamily protein [Gossypium australe]
MDGVLGSCHRVEKSLASDSNLFYDVFSFTKNFMRGNGINYYKVLVAEGSWTWKNICELKYGGLVFRDLAKFNVALLAKQGWRLLEHPDSLVAQVLKAKYYPTTNFLQARLGRRPSYTWKSIWAAKSLIKEGLGWRVGTGEHILINEDAWLPGAANYRICYPILNTDITTVASLIDSNNRKWREELIRNTFEANDADRILQIPLALDEHADMVIWRGEPSGKFTIRSAYRLLQTQDRTLDSTATQNTATLFYKQLWTLQIPNKIKIMLWMITRNYIPTMANLYQRRVVRDDKCPRCKACSENLWHKFVGCPAATELWKRLDFEWINQGEPSEWFDWVTWIFSKCGETQRRVFVCGMWVLWLDRNRNLHEGKSYTGEDAANHVKYYIGEIDGLNGRQPKITEEVENWKVLEKPKIKINFDASFDSKNNRLASGIVARTENGEVEISKSYFHIVVGTAFDAEAIACYKPVLTGLEMGYTKVIIEGDSKSIVNKCMAQSVDKSQVSAHIRNIRRERSKFQTITFHYVPRSANHLAHTIATTSLKEMESIYLLEEVPCYANRQWELDRPRELIEMKKRKIGKGVFESDPNQNSQASSPMKMKSYPCKRQSWRQVIHNGWRF